MGTLQTVKLLSLAGHQGSLRCAVAALLLSACVHRPKPPEHAPAATATAPVHSPSRGNGQQAQVFTAGSENPAKMLIELDEAACRRLLERVPLEVRTSGATRGVRDPYRLQGSVEGIGFRPSWSTKRSDPSMEVVDCRLLLAFADAAPIFLRHGVHGLVYLSAYRPPSGELQASLRKSRHGAGMALDVGMLERLDGSVWSVARDFPKAMGRPPCESRESDPAAGSPEDLRALVCDLAISGLFSVVLTPNYNQDHHDHVHVELNARMPTVYLR